MESTTRYLASWIASFDAANMRAETIARARHAVLDWVGVTIAGAQEPLVDVLTKDAVENGENGESSLLGRREKVSPATAALINGAASHALDFDDVNWQMRGHPTVAVLPAVFSIAEQRRLNGRQTLEAFIVGYQIACVVGEMMGPSHYERGWHATATVGTLGAAAGASRLLGLNAEQCAHALGTAATQAAGLKAMFGTMCKPLHAGKAALNGLLSARWAGNGLTSNPDAIETHQGFAHTQSETFQNKTLPGSATLPLAIESGLYKYHAACFLTHASIDAVRRITDENNLQPSAVERVRLHVKSSHRDVCDIAEPASGLQVKFSIRHLLAMTIAGVDTTKLESYSQATAQRPDLADLRARVEIVPDETLSRHSAWVEIETSDGQRHQSLGDVGRPMQDTQAQWNKLQGKFRRLMTPALCDVRVEEIIKMIGSFDELPDVFELLQSLRK
jgi:2-methylcitrate dehydratase PrpD